MLVRASLRFLREVSILRDDHALSFRMRMTPSHLEWGRPITGKRPGRRLKVKDAQHVIHQGFHFRHRQYAFLRSHFDLCEHRRVRHQQSSPAGIRHRLHDRLAMRHQKAEFHSGVKPPPSAQSSYPANSVCKDLTGSGRHSLGIAFMIFRFLPVAAQVRPIVRSSQSSVFIRACQP